MHPSAEVRRVRSLGDHGPFSDIYHGVSRTLPLPRRASVSAVGLSGLFRLEEREALCSDEHSAAVALCSLAASVPSSPVDQRTFDIPPTPSPGADDSVAEWLASIQPPTKARLFETSHLVSKGRYATGTDSKGHLTVYEYEVDGITFMIDTETSMVRFTSIWKALGNTKADIARMQDGVPELAQYIKKIRGGFLKIQGTWLPFDIAKELSRRVAFKIRDDLVPLFGYDFPDSCLRPDQEGFGRIYFGCNKKGRKKLHASGAHQTSVFGPAKPVIFRNGELVELENQNSHGHFR